MVKTELRDYQKEGLSFLLHNAKSVLGFKTGLGKSLVLIAAVHYAIREVNKTDRAVLFAPKNACMKVWNVELEKHSDLRYIYIADLVRDGGFGAVGNYDIVIVRYSEVVKYEKLIAKLCKNKITLFDEIHKLKSVTTKRYKLVNGVCAKSPVKWGLTATAVLNTPLDLYGVINFLDRGSLGTFWDFKKRFCVLKKKYLYNTSVWVVVSYKNLDELELIRKKYILSRGQRIEVEFEDIEYEMSESDEAKYLDASAGAIGESYKEFAGRLPDLQRVVDGSMGAEGEAIVSRNGKLKAYIEVIRGILDKGESLLIFCEYYYTFDMLIEELGKEFNVPIFTMSGRGVEDVDVTPCIVVATSGGSESINLKFANHVLFYNIFFSIGKQIQSLGRITRMNSDYLDDLHCYLPKNDSNIDHYKYKLLEGHTALINKLLGHDANLPKEVGEVRHSLIEEMKRKLLWRLEN